MNPLDANLITGAANGEFLWRLLDVGLRGGLMVLAAALLLRLSGLRDAASRHRVLTVVMAGMLVLLPLGLWWGGALVTLPAPQWSWTPPLASQQESPLSTCPEGTLPSPQSAPGENGCLPASWQAGQSSGSEDAEIWQDSDDGDPGVRQTASSWRSPTDASRSSWSRFVLSLLPRSLADWAWLGLAFYLLGTVLLLGRILLGLYLRRRLVNRAQVLDEDFPLRVLRRLAGQAGRKVPRLLVSQSTCVPFAVPGAILLPPLWRKWSREQLRSVLAHEMAHLHRRDPYIHLASWLNRAFYWFHPGASWIARRLSEQAEEACDGLALRWTGQTPRSYAQHLINVAAPLGIRSNRLLIGGIPMARKPQVRRRIEALFQPPASPGRPAYGWIVLAALCCLLVASGFRLAALPAEPEPSLEAESAYQSGGQGTSVQPGFYMPVPTPQPTPQPTPRPQPMPHVSSSHEWSHGEHVEGAQPRPRPRPRPQPRPRPRPRPKPWVHVVPHVNVGVHVNTSGFRGGRGQEDDPAQRAELIRELADPDAAVRMEAALRLRRQVPTPQSVAALVGILGDDRVISTQPSQNGEWGQWETTPAAQAAFTLANYGEEAVDALLGVSGDASPVVRDHAVAALAMSDSPRALQPVLSALNDSAWRVRRSAAWGLGSMEARGQADALVDVLLDEQATVREMAAWSLGVMDARQSASSLSRSLLDDADAQVREMAAWSLGIMEVSEGLEALSQALQTDSHPKVREMAAWSLGVSDRRTGVSALTAALQDSDEGVRDMAVWALGTGDGGPDAAEALGMVMSDASPMVRERAAWAMGILGDSAAIPGLSTALSDNNAQVREMAAWSLGIIGDEQAVPPLGQALRDPDAQVRESVAWALGIIGEDSAVPALIGALNDADDDVCSSAAWALGIIGDSRAEEALLTLRERSDTSGDVRDTADWALRMIR
ncbi:MAG TPA: M56 family metallopeptidase [Acidobacteriota bacterium]|nr:M56 family metallopeptidase [Acidobacteriota bacterium]